MMTWWVLNWFFTIDRSIIPSSNVSFQFFLLSMFLAKCFIQGAFNVLYIFTTELSPTVLRNSFIGINSMVCISASSPSFSANLDFSFGKWCLWLRRHSLRCHLPQGWFNHFISCHHSFHLQVPMIIFSGLCVAASLFVWTLPETIHSPLPDTIWVHYSSYRNLMVMIAQRGLRSLDRGA